MAEKTKEMRSKALSEIESAEIIYQNLDDKEKRIFFQRISVIPIHFNKRNGKDAYPSQAGAFGGLIPKLGQAMSKLDYCMSQITSGRLDIGNIALTEQISNDAFWGEEGLCSTFSNRLREFQDKLQVAMDSADTRSRRKKKATSKPKKNGKRNTGKKTSGFEQLAKKEEDPKQLTEKAAEKSAASSSQQENV